MIGSGICMRRNLGIGNGTRAGWSDSRRSVNQGHAAARDPGKFTVRPGIVRSLVVAVLAVVVSADLTTTRACLRTRNTP